MNIGMSVALFIGFSYKVYLPIAALTSFCILFTKNRRYIVAFLLVVSIVSPVIWYISVVDKFNSIKTKTFDELPRHMIWAHGGYTQSSPVNSIESFDAAKRMGYYGIELDIHFLEEKGLVVAHDIYPKEADNKHYLLLETVFKRYRDHFYYWLDFKNLDIHNATKSGTILSNYVNLYALGGTPRKLCTL